MVLSQFGFTTSVYLQKTIKFIISSSFSGCATLLTLLCERRKRLDVLLSFALVIFFCVFHQRAGESASGKIHRVHEKPHRETFLTLYKQII